MENSAVYNVVGVTFEGRQEILSKFYKERYLVGGQYMVRLEEEADNQYDKNAIAVYLNTCKGDYEKIGYISKDENVELKNKMKNVLFSRLASMGAGRTGKMGLSIVVEFDKQD